MFLLIFLQLCYLSFYLLFWYYDLYILDKLILYLLYLTTIKALLFFSQLYLLF